jgi:hypothetical protein
MNASPERGSGHALPLEVSVPGVSSLYGGGTPRVALHPGLTTLVGPNGTGKTMMLRVLADQAERVLSGQLGAKKVRYLASGRSSLVERFRAAIEGPGHRENADAAIGNVTFRTQWWKIESVIGDFLALEERADLRLKVEARLQQLFSRSLKLNWTQSGLGISIVPMNGGKPYPANYEASGILQLVALLAAIHNDQIGVLLIDEPEISLHPQHQAFVLQEMQRVAGDPLRDSTKKIVVIATHSASMLAVSSVGDLPRAVFFSDSRRLPVQLAEDASELKGRKVSGLVARLGTTHRLAFFADTVLLVEGPSDEIIATQLAQAIDHPLLPLNAQIVPVTGKGEFLEVARLFRAMGKRVTVMADLDAIADSNVLVNYFSTTPGADEAATAYGHSSVVSLDGQVRSDFASLVDREWQSIAPIATLHSYWTDCPVNERTTETKRRATLATLLGSDDAFASTPVAADFKTLRSRYLVLLSILSTVGCHLLKRGTIESYFQTGAQVIGKPEAAASEASTFRTTPADELKRRYEDVVNALQDAAPRRKVNEDDLLRVKLAAGIASILQFMSRTMSEEQIAAQATSVLGADADLFRFENTSNEKNLRLRVHMKSPIFPRTTFPFEISDAENLNEVVRSRLAASTGTLP